LTAKSNKSKKEEKKGPKNKNLFDLFSLIDRIAVFFAVNLFFKACCFSGNVDVKKANADALWRRGRGAYFFMPLLFPGKILLKITIHANLSAFRLDKLLPRVFTGPRYTSEERGGRPWPGIPRYSVTVIGPNPRRRRPLDGD
jgi:hypothetical protein